MSGRLTVTLAAVAITVAISALVLQAGDRRQAVISALGAQTYIDCGLEKLNERERNNLLELIGTYPAMSYTESAAEAYLKRQGWRQVYVLGAVMVDTVFDEQHLVVSDQYKLYLLDPSIVPYLADPGVYWAYGTGSAWKLLYPDGEEEMFWATELE